MGVIQHQIRLGGSPFMAFVLSLIAGCNSNTPSSPRTEPAAPSAERVPSAGAEANAGHWERLKVTATAYNSVESQTSSHPFVGAWGNKLVPGMKGIAVSRDLLDMGLHHNSRVHIEGLEGEYSVVDVMNKRWRMRIDIYMGLDMAAAKRWGKRKVTIRYWDRGD